LSNQENRREERSLRRSRLRFLLCPKYTPIKTCLPNDVAEKVPSHSNWNVTEKQSPLQ